MRYNKVAGYGGGRRSSTCHGSRGFRLKYPRRFSVKRLRARVVYLFKLLNKWRSSYGQALRSLKKGIYATSRSSSSSSNNSSSRWSLVTKEPNMNMNMGRADCRLRSFGRSNSFYAEAIADCLEFIKRSSISVDQNPDIQR